MAIVRALRENLESVVRRCRERRAELEVAAQAWRESITRAFIRVEDVVYVGLGTLLGSIALVLLVAVAVAFVQALLGDTLPDRAVGLLDRILLILMIVELLYTVQVSFREHAQTPEPFLLVGLIAAIRRVLVVTAEFGEPGMKPDAVVHQFVLELSVLTALIIALAFSLFVLRKSGKAISVPSHQGE